MAGTAALERILRRDRVIVATSLLVAALLAWFYLVRMATDMPGMSVALNQLAAIPLQPWDGAYFLMIFLMWAVMMAGMMLPSVAPSILLFTRALQGNPDSARPVLRAYLFTTGYLLAWTAFSFIATLAQWGIETAALHIPSLVAVSPKVGGLILVVAGIYQWTPFKNACLDQCRSPMDFLTRHWRRSIPGAFRMGFEHGLYCLGCCWMLMALLFVGGVMNLLWITAITVFILLEKLMPYGAQAGRLSGVLLVAAGGLVLLYG